MIDRLKKLLGFTPSSGWLEAPFFDAVDGPRSALRQAREDMNVVGAFGAWQTSPSSSARKRFTPLLYLADARDADHAKLIHRRVWSQGVAPLLLIVTPEQIYLSEGFSFSNDRWFDHCVRRISPNALTAQELHDDLKRVQACRLSSSLAWRDFQINPHERVDKRLLSTLTALSTALSTRSGAHIEAANALIGRYLYFYILRDRGFLDDAWLARFDAAQAFDTRSNKLTTDCAWRVFDALDEMLNGAIFPRAKEGRNTFSNEDLRLLRDCIKLGDKLQSDGVQLSFFDFDLSSLQTETLSSIYEEFLKSEDIDGKRADGAFYTPPFVADFVLDRVEDMVTLTPQRRVIDCTAGSGVFIVGAYRRIIEHELQATKCRVLPASRLREILLGSIFGVEKNRSAHAVACFSLYLTILDYVDPGDVHQCLSGQASEKLFPPLAGQNVICRDLFELRTDEPVQKWDVALGNPPWGDIEDVTPLFEQQYATNSARVDASEAAEFTFWRNVDQFLQPGGITAMVLPTKSLMGPSASRFPQALSQTTELIGVANLSHLRYVLFSNARQAACVLLTRNQKPNSASTFWVYSPTRTNLIGPVKGDPWFINTDQSRMETLRQQEVVLAEQAGVKWFELLMLRSVDRHIKRYLEDSVSIGRRIISLKVLLKKVNAQLKRGGSPAQTGLPLSLIFGADKHKDNNIRMKPGVHLLNQIDAQRSLFQSEDYRTMSAQPDWLDYVPEFFVRPFSGNCLLVPRSMVDLAYASTPIAFNSSVNAIFFTENSPTGKQARRDFLVALGLFFESSVAKYLFALFGQLWILDRTRLEKNNIIEMPVPFTGVDDPMVAQFLNATDADRTELVCDRFQLSGVFLKAVKEYLTFRAQYEDGGVPAQSIVPPDLHDLTLYKEALAFVLRPISMGNTMIDVSPRKLTNDVIAVSVTFSGQTPFNLLTEDTLGAGISMVFDANLGQVLYTKPAEKFRWTVEAAHADCAMLIEKLMDPANASH